MKPKRQYQLSHPAHYQAIAQAWDGAESFGETFRWPLGIRHYAETVLGVKLNGRHGFCPSHTGTTGHAFAIDERYDKATCFGACGFTGDAFDWHRQCFEFASEAEARADFLARKREISSEGAVPLPTGRRELPRRRPAATAQTAATARDEELLARIRAEGTPLVRNTYNQFALCQALVARVFRPDDLPIVAFDKYKHGLRIGAAARRALTDFRSLGRLPQFICGGIAKTVTGGRSRDNLAETVLLCTEWDDETKEDQLKLIEHLCSREEWPLLSVCWSGGKSYHAHWYVRG